ncbi:MAG: nuclear transport factor 2 family protein, partial [Pseudomonadota bacterium]
ERNPVRDIRIVRSVVDGQYVFVQAYQDINNGEARWVTTDLFDTDADDKIVEHWDVIAPYVDETVSGRTQIDGPTEITDLEATESNKRLVGEFLDEVLVNGNAARAVDFISTETYHQHNPQVGDGLDGFAAFAAELANEGKALRYEEVFKLIGQGNVVVSYSRMSLGEEQYAVFDIFRLENGQIVEHWDNMEVIPPPGQWGNSGKF